jgi:Na+-translocating ferredoxin:NAD+ oxidoreductase RnfC subunit
VRHVLGGAKHCIIAVEDNKPEAFNALRERIGELVDNACIRIWQLYKSPRAIQQAANGNSSKC